MFQVHLLASIHHIITSMHVITYMDGLCLPLSAVNTVTALGNII